MSDDVKNAILKNIKNFYPDAKYYKDGEIKKYPCFYITLTSIIGVGYGLQINDHNLINYFFRIEYRESSTPSLTQMLNTKLDDVKNTLVYCLRYLTIDGEKYKTNITNNETVDNVLIFEGNIKILVNNKQPSDAEKMQQIKANTEIKEV